MPLYFFNYNWARISAEFLICYYHKVSISTVLHSRQPPKHISVCFKSHTLVAVERYKISYLTLTAKLNWIYKKVSLQSIKDTRPFVQLPRGLNYDLFLWRCEVHVVYSNTCTNKSQKNRDRSPCVKPGAEPTNPRENSTHSPIIKITNANNTANMG